MDENRECPACGATNSLDDASCKDCNAKLNPNPAGENTSEGGFEVSSPDEGDEQEEGQLDDPDYGQIGPYREDEFAELDYRPKKKPGLIFSGAIILFALLIIVGGVIFLSGEDPEPVAGPGNDNQEIEVHEVDEEDEPEQPDQDASEDADLEQDPGPDPQEDPEEQEPDEEGPPDYDKLESVMHGWLIERIEDPDVLLVPNDEMEDIAEDFDEYISQEEEIIVYMIESTEDEFATVLLGVPFSEWSLRVVFIWDGTDWKFLREAEL